ncbi:MAG: glycerol-3-phosphate dehydrogenase [Chloroflexi bacterium]|nr:glycerol-3-phosphate dehydrogenase [Chloroflexota bacterium]
MAIVTIIGAGMMGTALCWPLYDNKHTVRLVGTHLDQEIIQSIQADGIHPKLQRAIPDGVQAFYSTELETAMQGADVILNGVSSFGTDWFAQQAGPYLRPEVPVLAVTKGLQVLPNGDVQPLPDYINHQLPVDLQNTISFNAIAGPCIAHELAARRQTCVVFCGRDDNSLKQLKDVFSTPYYHIWTSYDLKEIEICAALKNGYALAVGMIIGMSDRAGTDGLANMYNPQAAIFAQSCIEMQILIKALGGNEKHVTWLPGAGDLYVTVYGGRTRKLGQLLGQGHNTEDALEMMSDVTLESVEIIARTAEALKLLEASKRIELKQFPLLCFLNDVLHHHQPVDIPWDDFFPEGAGRFPFTPNRVNE